MADNINVELSEADNISVQLQEVDNISVTIQDVALTLDTDVTLSGDSDYVVASQHAIKTYVDNAVGAENLWDRSGTTLSPHTSGDAIYVETVKLNTSPSVTPLQGQMYWDDADKTVAVNLDTDNSVTLQVGQEQHVRVVNKTGVTITDGQVIYISGAQGNRPTASLADASDITKCRVIGVATQDIANNAEGYVTTMGIVHGFDTSGFLDGDALYLSASTPGALTTTAPTSPHCVVHVGTALNSTNNGKIFIHPHSPLDTDTSLSDNSDEIAPTQKAVKAYVDSQVGAENLWDRTSTTLSPHTANDSVNIGSGTLTAGAASISGNLTVDTDTLFVDATNNRVGVRTLTPQDTLSVEASANLKGILVNRNSTSTGASSAITFCVTSSTPGAQAYIAMERTNSPSSADTDFVFGLRNTAAVAEKMRLTNAALLGIGTSAPTHTLTIPSTGTGIALYNTVDQTTNYERFLIKWSSNVLQLGTEISSGATARVLSLRASNLGATAYASFDIRRDATPFYEFNPSSTGVSGTIVKISGGSTLSSSSQISLSISPTHTQSGTAGYTALLVNPTESSTGSGSKLLADFQVGGTSKFKVDNTGKITSVATAINIATQTPASASATGTQGDIAWDSSYIYVCTATNTWKRAALSTW